MWKYYAVFSAVFAAATAIFAKLGLKNVDSNLATAIRTTVILMLAWSVVLIGSGVSHAVHAQQGEHFHHSKPDHLDHYGEAIF